MSAGESVFESWLERAGDDLWRLALILGGDSRRAARMIEAVCRGRSLLRRSDLHLTDLPAALLTVVLPRVKRGTVPAWGTSSDPQLASALAQLAPGERASLLAAPLRSLALAGQPGVTDERQALFALATHMGLASTLDPVQAPQACQPVRRALRDDQSALSREPALRGHLALCEACRTAAQTWRTLAQRVDVVLRDALRDAALPDELAARLRHRFAPQQQRLWQRPAVLRAAVPAAIVLLIIALIFPRPAVPVPTSGTASAPAGDPAALVARASAALYAPPVGDGLRYDLYTIRWLFNDGSIALLDAEVWRDTSSPRHRVVLRHEAGGAPFEFQQGDGEQQIWYAVEQRYADALGLPRELAPAATTRFALPATDQPALLDARLASGAWAIAGEYLAQARAAVVQSYGRRGGEDGTQLDVVGFQGVSPLAQAATPDRPRVPVTVLLSIDASTGALREVRELAGETGGEQSARTTWRWQAGEWLSDAQERSAFTLGRDWNPAAAREYPQPASAMLASVPADRLLSPVQALLAEDTRIFAPTTPPPGATSAALVSGTDPETIGLVYSGFGRQLAIVTTTDSEQPRRIDAVPPNAERVLGPLAAQRPRADAGTVFAQLPLYFSYLPGGRVTIVAAPVADNTRSYRSTITTVGYTRDELLALVQTLAPLNATSIQAQQALFASAPGGDPLVETTILRALALDAPPESGTAQQLVIREYLRQRPDLPRTSTGNDASDEMPFQMPLYRDRPPTTRIDQILVRAADGTFAQQLTRTTEDGRLIYRAFSDTQQGWNFDAFSTELYTYTMEHTAESGGRAPRSGITSSRLFALADCAKIDLLNLGERQILRVVETNWRRNSCMHGDYAEVAKMQASGLDNQLRYVFQEYPYLADILGSTPLITVFQFDADGRLVQIDVNAGRDDRLLLYSLVVERDERIAPPVLEAQPPAGLVKDWQGIDTTSGTMLTIDQFRTVSGVTLYTMANYTVDRIERATPPPGRLVYATNPFEQAYRNGKAYKVEVSREVEGATLQVTLYQGSIVEFGAFLRTNSTFRRSRSTLIRVDGRTVPAWEVLGSGGERVVLVQLDDALLIMPVPYHGGDIVLTPVP